MYRWTPLLLLTDLHTTLDWHYQLCHCEIPRGYAYVTDASKLYDVTVLMFYVSWFRHLGDSNVSALLLLSNTAYINELTDASEPYDSNLLCLVSKPVCLVAWVIPRDMNYAVPLWHARWSQNHWCSPSSWSTNMSCRVSSRRYPSCSFVHIFRSLLSRDEQAHNFLNRRMIYYSTLQHRWPYLAAQPGERALWIENLAFLLVFATKTVG